MRLRDDPLAFVKGVRDEHGSYQALHFTCPKDGCLILVRFTRDKPFHKLDKHTGVWEASGEFPDTFTLTPSVDVLEHEDGPSHWHGHVTNGVAS